MARNTRRGAKTDDARLIAEMQLQESLIKDLESLLYDHSTSDLEFLVGPKRESVRAHKVMVLSRCEKYKSRKQQWLAAAPEQKITSVVLEKFEAKSVRNVVKYLYTGKIDLRNEDVFHVLALCSEFGLPILQTYCVGHLAQNLTVDSVCSTLIGAHSSLEESKGGMTEATLQEIVQKCLKFIEANVAAVFQLDDFMQLSKELLIAVISSSKLSSPAETVWQVVLQWGQQRAGVGKTMVLWSEEDREKVKRELEGVLECVRVMDISSEFFAKEVEPTGLLPMEMTLARYRHAAVHGSSDSRNGGEEPFVGSDILGGRADLQRQINDWCELGTQEWVLLYRGSRDGFHARNFHSCCDERGATVVIVKTPSGYMFGGYTDVSWSSRFKRGKFSSSQKSFVFSLVNPSNTSPSKFDIKQPAYAINNHPSNGPIFGSGADICISSDCNRNKDSYSQLPYSYGDGTIPQFLLTGEQYFSVEDYEVYGLTS